MTSCQICVFVIHNHLGPRPTQPVLRSPTICWRKVTVIFPRKTSWICVFVVLNNLLYGQCHWPNFMPLTQFSLIPKHLFHSSRKLHSLCCTSPHVSLESVLCDISVCLSFNGTNGECFRGFLKACEVYKSIIALTLILLWKKCM